MLEAIFESTTDAAFTVGGATACILAALALGCAVSFTYAKNAGGGASSNFLLTLIILPAVICAIIMLVGSNVARAFSLAGAFSLVRFRSEPGDPKDIAYVCLVMAIGLSTGMGYLTYAAMFTAILCAILFAYTLLMVRRMGGVRHLRIAIPEDLNYAGIFEEVFEQYTSRHTLTKVRTSDLGSLFRLDYTVVLKNTAQEKEFLDRLRCLNGNLDISLLLAAAG